MTSRPITSATDVHRSRTGRPAVLDLRPGNGQTPVPPAAPNAVVDPNRHSNLHQTRLAQAKATPRSPLVAKFALSTEQPEPIVPITPVTAPPAPAETATKNEPITASTSPAVTIPPAGSSIQPDPVPPVMAEPSADADAAESSAEPTWRPHLGLAPRSGRIATGLTAVAIFAGYIWLHNYPKLALDAANSRAGIEAVLPSYMPANYNLSNTSTGPGLITFDFTNPNLNEVLKIAQARTSWDSHSLLDNFVAKQTDSYATVQGQGLTIFIFNQNEATWVNHGLWYRIEGASKLSREQILQIAYSL